MPKLTKGKTYKIQWADAQSHPKWHELPEVFKIPPVIVESTYIYLGRSKAGYCFAGEANSDQEYGNITIIPSLQDIKSAKLIR